MSDSLPTRVRTGAVATGSPPKVELHRTRIAFKLTRSLPKSEWASLKRRTERETLGLLASLCQVRKPAGFRGAPSAKVFRALCYNFASFSTNNPTPPSNSGGKTMATQLSRAATPLARIEELLGDNARTLLDHTVANISPKTRSICPVPISSIASGPILIARRRSCAHCNRCLITADWRVPDIFRSCRSIRASNIRPVRRSLRIRSISILKTSSSSRSKAAATQLPRPTACWELSRANTRTRFRSS